MLIIGNEDVRKLLTMREVIESLEASYRALVTKEAVCRPRIDIRIPTSEAGKTYQWGTMEPFDGPVWVRLPLSSAKRAPDEFRIAPSLLLKPPGSS